MKFNKNPYTLPKNYVFKAVREKAAEFKKTSGIKPIDLGVGDVKLPLFALTVSGVSVPSAARFSWVRRNSVNSV